MSAPGYYAIIPANVRYDNELIPNAKLLYGEITALCNQDGFCWAENAYFADLYSVSVYTISRWVSKLQSKGYILTELQKSDGNKRKITLAEKRNTSCGKAQDLLTKSARPIDEKRKSYIRINNTINNTSNSDENAHAFLQLNYPIRYEKFLMSYKTKITDFQSMLMDFDFKVIEEELKWEQKILFARLERLASNWIRVQEKDAAKNKSIVPEQTTATRKIFTGH